MLSGPVAGGAHAWAPFLLPMRGEIMAQDFLTYEQQINKLRDEKGLIVTNDLFAVVIALRYLIRNDEFLAFRRTLSWLMKQVLKDCPHLTEQQLYAQMGFPTNWEKITLYKK
jgi:hypothetical protein